MKAMSVRQPFAWAIMQAGKDLESRDRRTNYRGALAIHAPQGMTIDEYLEGRKFINSIVHGAQNRVIDIPSRKEFVKGAIIGVVSIVACVTESDSPWFKGDYGFVLEDPRPLVNPIYGRGAMGLWDVSAEIEESIQAQLRTQAV